MNIKGAIFDMDGTIIDSLMFWDHLWQRIGETYLQDPDFKPKVETDRAVRTMIFRDAMTYFHEQYNLQTPIDEFISFAEGDLSGFYKDVAKVKPGAKELLRYLKEGGVKMCLASATAKKDVLFALESHGLLEYFDTVLSCADIGVGKDRPDIYLMALDTMELDACDVCVFEDSFVALRTARASGFKTVGVFDRYNFAQDILRSESDIYLEDGKPLDSLTKSIEL